MMALIENGESVLPAWRLLMLLFVLALLPPAQTRAAGDDPFPACMAETGGDGAACLARQGGWYDWAASKTACRFVGERVDAVIAAGGDAKWADLFRNERCARLGLPHGPVAAAAGDRVVPDHPYVQCVTLKAGRSVYCDDSMGRHAYYPYKKASCEHFRDTLPELHQKPRRPYSPSASFENERCWRLGLPHFESK